MACAGYLVLESATPMLVEVSTGVLYCRRVRASAGDKNHEATPAGDATSEEMPRALPALEPRAMDKREASPTSSQQHKMAGMLELELESGSGAEPEPEPARAQQVADEGREEDAVERVLQLSGLVVDVLEREDELDVPSLPGSFQVMTYKVSREPDGSTSSTLRDSVILTARDAASKRLWIKHIKHWNRFGWRETEAISAARSDLEALEAMVRCFQQTARERREKLRASMSGRPSSSGSSSQRQHRRRFYRATAHLPLVPPP
jgi:hypothetical protein